ncbi:MAG TPA: hypothetical protein VF516_01210 [Kofleriaceae bacterium]
MDLPAGRSLDRECYRRTTRASSEAYQRIAQDRIAATEGPVLLVREISGAGASVDGLTTPLTRPGCSSAISARRDSCARRARPVQDLRGLAAHAARRARNLR